MTNTFTTKEKPGGPDSGASEGRGGHDSLPTGLIFSDTSKFDLKGACREAFDRAFSFIGLPLIDEEGQFAVRGKELFDGTFRFQERVVGLVSSPKANEDKSSYARTFRKQYGWAAHLNLTAVLIPLPKSLSDVTTVAHCLNEALVDVGFGGLGEIWVQTSSWRRWNFFRGFFRTVRFGLAWELPRDLPSKTAVKIIQAEPVHAVLVRPHVFRPNQAGYPSLPKGHQSALEPFLRRDLPFLFTASDEVDITHCQKYIAHLRDILPPLSQAEQYCKDYEDTLQVPLQPLASNLDFGTYQVFEGDPPKYEQYERAIYAALLRNHKKDLKEPVEVAVVGAGPRGPLIARTLAASKQSRRPVAITAVEKNKFAFEILKHYAENSFAEANLELLCLDMRTWKPEKRFDIVVSELLGSFGDNELSPECLEPVMHLLKDSGVSIPSRTTSYAAPLFCPRLHEDCQKSMVPYVVNLKAAAELAEAKPFWTFHHSHKLRGDVNHERAHHATYTAQSDGVVHGVAGYFDAILFGDVTLSTVPVSHTPGMCSWFPLFFPIAQPIPVTEGQTIQISIWRKTQAFKVWYEWSVVNVDLRLASELQNPSGRDSSILLQ